MPTTEERVVTLEEIARNHAAQLQGLMRLAESSARVEQQIVHTLGDLTLRFGRIEETNRLLVTGMEALQAGMGVLQTEIRGLRTEMGEFRVQVGVWVQTVEQRFDTLPTTIARVVADELRGLPEAIAKAVAEEFRPLLLLWEEVEALKRRVESLEKQQTKP